MARRREEQADDDAQLEQVIEASLMVQSKADEDLQDALERTKVDVGGSGTRRPSPSPRRGNEPGQASGLDEAVTFPPGFDEALSEYLDRLASGEPMPQQPPQYILSAGDLVRLWRQRRLQKLHPWRR